VSSPEQLGIAFNRFTGGLRLRNGVPSVQPISVARNRDQAGGGIRQ
jgi:hypothetical protein